MCKMTRVFEYALASLDWKNTSILEIDTNVGLQAGDRTSDMHLLTVGTAYQAHYNLEVAEGVPGTL